MKNKEFIEYLKSKNACDEAMEWVGEKSWKEVYETCPRGDWMLWLFKKTNPDDLKELTFAKGHCANTVRHLMKDERSIKAIDIAIAFGEGKATKEELNIAAAYAANVAAYAADATAAANVAAYAAAAAAHADAAAAIAASAAAADATAASAAADAYAVAAADVYAIAAASAAVAAAKVQNQSETADICRKYLPIEIWKL